MTAASLTTLGLLPPGSTTSHLLTSATDAAEWQVWTTTARLVVTDAGALDAARELVVAHLAEVDLAASRFRPDSEVSRLARADAVVRTPVSPLLGCLLRTALAAAERTGGDVDPTLGAVLVGLGYDRDVSLALAPEPTTGPPPRVDWREVRLDGDLLSLPAGVLLDLGATAKASAADYCATAIANRFGCGALVSLGGDLRVAGPAPLGGWQVLVQDGDDEPASLIRLTGAAAVATSSTLHRRWRADGRTLHHIVDPRTGEPATAVWRTVSVGTDTCAAANALSTAAVVRGYAALHLLESAEVAARLVAADGSVHRIGGWPS